MKITFIGAGSTVFAGNVIGDCLYTDSLKHAEFALYDIDENRLKEAKTLIDALNRGAGSPATITTYLGEEQRKDALRGADFAINAIQVGGYDPCTITDFEIPKKYGLRQTIADTLGIGGIMRALRTIPVLESIARDMEEVCPDAWLLNYTNPMAILTGYLQRYTKVKTIGLCHSVQVCSNRLLTKLGMEDKLEGRKELIAGINHMAWLLDIRDKDGNDLYPEIKKRAFEILDKGEGKDLVRYDYMRRLGYYCTESSEHNAEYNMFYIKSKYPELIERYNIPLDDYPRRCVEQIEKWAETYKELVKSEVKEHTRSREYASHIMSAIVTDTPYQIGGNVINTGHLISNLPEEACVEVPCLVNGHGITPCRIGALPTQLAAMNSMNVNVQLLTIEAAHTKEKRKIYQAAMMDPHTASELSPDDIEAMVDDLIAAHGDWLPEYH
ncbi:MAG: alpha-glucosidase/alpha-galactosidase [Clostridia bacterium]|nr:alpha-glucosidase/alpha-galactosidase [Clostridia bacterium]